MQMDRTSRYPSPSQCRSGSFLLLLLLSCLLLVGPMAFAQDYDDEEDEFTRLKPGLIGSYWTGEKDTDQASQVRRIDPRLSFKWHGNPPDPRLASADFSTSWQGRLFVMAPGEYRLHVFAVGRVEMKLAGEAILSKSSAEPTWMAASPAQLRYGFHPLEIRYKSAGPDSQLAFFWEGPQFQLEPVPNRHLRYDPADMASDTYRRGELLVHALRCAACHDTPQPAAVLASPSLKNLRGNLDPAWITSWLSGKPKEEAGSKDQGPKNSPLVALLNKAQPSGRRMPHFDLSQPEAQAVSAYLYANSTASPKPVRVKAKKEADPERGALVLHQVGCLACHQVDGVGAQGLFDGGDLTKIAAKRPADFFIRWLKDPASVNSAHRMPVVRLENQELVDLAAYLGQRGESGKSEQPDGDEDQISLGRKILEQNNCAACHEIPGIKRPQTIAIKSGSESGCFMKASADTKRPRFHLNAEDEQSIATYLRDSAPREESSDEKEAPRGDGSLVLAERNCIACHAREDFAGIEQFIGSVTGKFPELAPLTPALKPPALFGIGDKLHAEALEAAIATRNAPLRPWLAVRMPKFNLDDAERKSLVEYLIDADRMPPLPEQKKSVPPTDALLAAGGRLVTSGGFGCTSCHQIGTAEPHKVELKSHGTDLTLLGQRLRRPWYDRWMHNPARIVPRMEMPALVAPIRGVLGDDLNDQLAAVWHVLNEPGFNPPRPNPVRVVRNHNVPDLPERGHVLTDVVEVGKERFIKPLLVGLPNRHNVLFDLETAALRRWYLGDTASQHTRGKSWYWEAAGTELYDRGQTASEWRLLRGSASLTPQLRGQFPTEADWFETIGDSVRCQLRLQFPGQETKPWQLQITQTFAPAASHAPRSGFVRTVELDGINQSGGERILWQIVPPSLIESEEVGQVQLRGAPGPTAVSAERFDGKVWKQVALEQGSIGVELQPNVTAKCRISYVTQVPVDQFFPKQVPAPPSFTEELDVVPGYQAEVLPIPSEVMPTGLAWLPNGKLIIGSLKGRVWLASDTDGDGLEDALEPFSDELACPYGVAAAPDADAVQAVNVITKYGLLRLLDRDGDGHAERTETLASGWGHTADYHDWAVGLPRTPDGSYWIGLPCQQDQRSPAGAYLRGHALRLVPRKATPDDPRKFAVEDYCAGLRFPMGLAIDRQGTFVASDNQGNYNPFNELNHLLPGRRYGFINKLEWTPDFHPSATPAAVEIPHPWTRSVNGLTFLETPTELAKKLAPGQSHFGPFEGHLLGCEYDSRALIRMSLEEVEGVMQGAAYPFTMPRAADAAMQGPLVCHVATDGDLYVGNIRDSAWGGGANTGSLVRLAPAAELPAGIAEVKALPHGFQIEFTQPVDSQKAAKSELYGISSYQRISTPAYGGDDKDRRQEKIRTLEVAQDGRSVRVLLTNPLREGFVYEFQLDSLASGEELFFPAEAFYTLRRTPKR